MKKSALLYVRSCPKDIYSIAASVTLPSLADKESPQVISICQHVNARIKPPYAQVFFSFLFLLKMKETLSSPRSYYIFRLGFEPSAKQAVLA